MIGTSSNPFDSKTILEGIRRWVESETPTEASGQVNKLATMVADGYRDLPATTHLHTLADATDEMAAKAAARFGFENSTGDWRALVNNPDIDVVDITSPNAMHREMALAEHLRFLQQRECRGSDLPLVQKLGFVRAAEAGHTQLTLRVVW